MINKNVLIEYVKILNEGNFSILTNDQLYIINLVNNEASVNKQFSEFLNNLINSEDKIMAIEKYFEEINSKNNKVTVEEELSKTFGIDISKIEHKILANGKEIFCFYDTVSSKNVALENEKNGVTLVEQLKEIQLQNESYQTNDDVKNTQNILEDKRFKENCELTMVPISEIGNHLNEISGLTIDDYKKLNFMILNAESLGIISVNIENIVGFDKDGKLYEVYSNDLKTGYMIGEADTIKYFEEKVKDSENMDNYDILEKTYEKNSSDVQFYDLDEEMQQKIIMFYEYPNMLNNLSLEEQNFWKMYITIYEKELENENKEINKNKPKQYILKKENESSHGYINLKLIILTGFIVFIGVILFLFRME